MQRDLIRSFARDERGAISPLYAVGILVLVAMAGIGFDYGRVMALDTELQNAADQAALAAATQLDGASGARDRARAAALNALGNQTRFAVGGRDLTIPSANVEFFDGYTVDASTDNFGGAATSDSNAKVVQVTIDSRTVRYALTPVVGAFAGQAMGRAAAMLNEATCNVPPMMFCVPNDPTTGTANRSFPTANDIGRGLKLHFKSNGLDTPGNPNDDTVDNTVWAPGNFGFLDLDYPGVTGNNKNATTGLNSDALGCTATPPASDPGFRTPQGSALNSRFDLYPPPKKNCDSSTGDFCPAQNARKNLLLKINKNAADCSNPPNGNSIQSGDWIDPASIGAPDPGYPQDLCFSSNCSVIGDKDWGAASWLTAQHGTSTIPGLDANGDGNISRYEVYLWELQDKANRLRPAGPYTDSKGDKYCSYPYPVDQPWTPPSSLPPKDRRILTVAAVDCTGLNGKAPVDILRWVDVFLVQPVATSASDRNFFTEIKGPGTPPSGKSGFQYFSRRKAVLIR